MVHLVTAGESAAAELERRMRALEARVAALESRGSDEFREAAPVETPAPVAGDEPERAFDLALAGRASIILGGAYLVRAITQHPLVPDLLGMFAGLAYALYWVADADRIAGKRVFRAVIEEAVAALIAFSLIWESAVRFHFISSTTASALVCAIALLMLGVALHRRVALLAWIAVLGSTLTVLIIGVSSKAVIAPAAVVLIVSWAASQVERRAGWEFIDALPSLQFDLLLLLMPLAIRWSGESATGALVIAVVAIVTQSILVTLPAREVEIERMAFHRFHSAVLFIAATSAAVMLTEAASAQRLAFAAALLAAAIIITARSGVAATKAAGVYFASLSTLLVIGAAALALPRELASAVCALLGLSFAVAGVWERWRMAPLRAAIFAFGAAIGSGLFASAVTATFATPERAAAVGFGWEDALALGAVIVAAAAPYVRMRQRVEEGSWVRTAMLALAALLVSGALVIGAHRALPLLAQTPAAVVTLRTVLLASAALLFGALSRNGRFEEARRLVIPLLIAGGIKLLYDDLRFGTAATLFVSLAAYGVALLIASRLRRRVIGVRPA
jgi:hypothetical protein